MNPWYFGSGYLCKSYNISPQANKNVSGWVDFRVDTNKQKFMCLTITILFKILDDNLHDCVYSNLALIHDLYSVWGTNHAPLGLVIVTFPHLYRRFPCNIARSFSGGNHGPLVTDYIMLTAIFCLTVHQLALTELTRRISLGCILLYEHKYLLIKFKY